MTPTDPDGPLTPVEAEVASRLRHVAEEAADLYWPFNARDVIEVVPTKSGAGHPHRGPSRRWRPWTHRLMVVAVAVAILVVFFVPLPHLNLFNHLVIPTRAGEPSIGTRLAELKASDAAGSSGFGDSVAISGRTAVVADIGGVYVFSESGPNWRQVAELNGYDVSGTANGCSTDFPSGVFPDSVAISGATVVVGVPCAGLAYVFVRSRAAWKQVASLEGSDTVPGDGFGTSVAISGTVIVVGANSHANSAGRAYVFTKAASSWLQVAELKGSDTVAGDEFGYAVAVSSSAIVVGAYHAGAGRAYVFAKPASTWEQVAELNGSDTVNGDEFGYALAVSGTTIVVGAAKAGRVYVFTKSASGWSQTAELKGSDSEASDEFGCSVAIAGRTAVVGAFGHPRAGEAYVFTKTATAWKQVATLKSFDTVPADRLSGLVAISGTVAVVSGDGAGNYEGRVYVFNA